MCIRKFRCVLEKILVFLKRLLCSRKDCCVLERIVVFSKRLLCSSKDCCVSEQELSCVLPVWATVLLEAYRIKPSMMTKPAFNPVKKNNNRSYYYVRVANNNLRYNLRLP